MTIEEALADVCRHMCGARNAARGTHDDACTTIRSAVAVDHALRAVLDQPTKDVAS